MQLAARTSPRPGLILPVVAWVVAMLLSIRNFYIAFDVEFSLFAFLAALVLFVFYAVPAMFFSLLYIDGRKEVRASTLARSKRVRQARTQQRVQSNLQHRNDPANVQREPIVYMPENRTSRATSANAAARKSRSRSRSTTTRKRP